MKLALRFVFILLVVPIVGDEPTHAPSNEYDLLRSFPPGRLAALCAYDQPDAKGLTGSNRINGSWLEAGPQRGSCRGVVAAVVSIFYGQTLALHVPLPEFEAALPKAVAWQFTRIRDNGEVEVTGNTRTGVGKEKSYTGQPKDVNYNEVVFALTYYGLAHHDQAALTAAGRVFAFSHPP